MPMIDCPRCERGIVWDIEQLSPNVSIDRGSQCRMCHGTGRVPDDFFPEDSEELPMNESRLVADMPPNLIQVLKDHGIFCCARIVPRCDGEPYAEVVGVDGETRHLFCRQCTVDYCIRHGVTFPMSDLRDPDEEPEQISPNNPRGVK